MMPVDMPSDQRNAAALADESGATAIEYGLLMALIVVAIIGGVSATGTSVTHIYDTWTAAVMAVIS